jgi:polysaccharide export outer membrane protein
MFDKMKYYKLLMVVIAILFASCNAQERVLYLQGVESGSEIDIPKSYEMRIKPLDQLTVIVNSQDPELALPFNTSTGFSSVAGSRETTPTTGTLQVLSVDKDGYLDLPVLGRIKCSGMTRREFASLIEKKIIEGGYIADPKVNVRFAQLSISVLGEVTTPGHYNIDKDQITIFDALAMARDMTIYGSREDVAVIREKDGKRIITKLDLRSPEIFNSPCYYLEQNDIVIVSPNKYKAATAEINQNRSFWISLASTGISLATLVMTIIR